MPVLTCGGMRHQYRWQDVPLDDIPAEKQANLEATVRRALDLGINHIETDHGNLIFAGHPKRGCLYAVYSFLQDVVGVRWWAPEDTFVPKKSTLVVADDLLVSYSVGKKSLQSLALNPKDFAT
jgi:hypothetical protein